MIEILPCPFCDSKDIKYSLKVTGNFEKQYRSTMYCNQCFAYGPRVLTKKIKGDDYPGRSAIERNEEYMIAAIIAWNERSIKC